MLAPTLSATRGDLVVQSSFYTSSIYVNKLRDDITALILTFHARYSSPGFNNQQPFKLFKDIWCQLGWPWLHLTIFDDRPREKFLEVTLRLFAERIVKTEAPFTRAAALFGLYTFFYTQPSDAQPPLYSIKHIPLPYNVYHSLMVLPDVFSSDMLRPLLPVISGIIQSLFSSNVFYILPRTDQFAQNPQTLPREVFMADPSAILANSVPKKKGRPSKRDKANRGKSALAGLDHWLKTTSYPTSTSSQQSQVPAASLAGYRAHKAQLLNMMGPRNAMSEGHSMMQQANMHVLGRLKQAEQASGEPVNESSAIAGLQRIETAVKEMMDYRGLGLLSLTEGSGRPKDAR